MMIPYGRQHIAEDDIRAVAEVLRSDWLTGGPAGPRFEAAAAGKVGATEAVAVNSATSALHIACLALGLGPGDILWTSPNTFVASANCARYCGAEVDFVDIDPLTYNLSPEALADKLRLAAKKNRLPKIVVPVHFAGQSCDMRAIADLAAQYGFKIIEDASHAIGGEYLGRPVGVCRFSDITVFSFHPVKIITTAEGGLAVTNDRELAGRMRSLRSHGITRDESLMTGPADGPWYYQQLELGFNYRLTDLQAALGLAQLSRLELFVARRRELAARYDRLLADLPLILPHQAAEGGSSFHLYPVMIDRRRVAKSRLEVFNRLRSGGIGVNVHYIPVHTQPYYRRLGFKPGDFPAAEEYYAAALSLPLFYGLTDAMQDTVVARLGEALE
ncbi:UDP-4-amino-4,6-dideoxy-N-acetyl-beta-L-altrosamine transaminase [Deltaproteobacteria bacterium OttesenSCG-928-M10]|nr:UDP-4-amino-4,6-dideoxy-N-acetyl-beta-L-altrosamine transaminase [Deltaproteobacteria bacterium OttesenSCG-928-M10]